jgi:indoleamine 2,3-dioxygenase
MVLAFLISFFVHSQPPKTDSQPIHVPECLAVPIVDVSRILGIAPVLTFADTVLWNWSPKNPSLPLSADNVKFMHTFSGTETEQNFYTLSTKAEIKGVEMLRIIDSYAHLPDATDFASISKTTKDLSRLAIVVHELTDTLTDVKGEVDPYSFYWEVRPWYNGSDAKGPSAPGWVYDGVPATESLDLSGPSAGQSTVVHALDVFLDVDHKLQQRRSPAPSAGNKKADRSFMDRMRRYMPGPHQKFLADLSNLPVPLRALADDTPLLRESYNTVVLALKQFRDSHIRMATLYIVSMSKSSPPTSAGGESNQEPQGKGYDGPVRGTGGTSLSTLLKAGRDATARTMLVRN